MRSRSDLDSIPVAHEEKQGMAEKKNPNLMVVFTNAAPGRDAEFNRWYDEVHVGEVLASGPFLSCQRFQLSSAQIEAELPHRYMALYEFEGDPAVAKEALLKAAGTMHMSDSMRDPKLYIVEPITPRVPKR
jgi:hypothetical protein